MLGINKKRAAKKYKRNVFRFLKIAVTYGRRRVFLEFQPLIHLDWR